jgi:mRNA-degrading endonuclease RelE of RelBE toxin-antitoxin system
LIQLIPFQIIFNPTSARELSKLPKEFQLEVLGDFRGFPQDVRSQDLDRFGKLERQGKRLYRYRLGDYRVYFERSELGIIIHRILNRNTLKDFLFRSRLPTGEDEALQDNPKFWELMETSSESSPH